MARQVLDTQQLRDHHLFATLPEAEFSRLMEKARLHKLRKEDFLFRQGTDATHFYYVVKGTIKLYRMMTDGSEKIIELVPAGMTFGEALMFNANSKYPVTAQAAENSTVVCFNNSDYLTLLKTFPDLALQLLSGITVRLRARINEIEVLSLKNASHRVVRYLIGLTMSSSEPCRQFKLPAEKRLIAGQLGIRPETFSRVIAHLKEEGIIDIKGRVITVLDQQALINYE